MKKMLLIFSALCFFLTQHIAVANMQKLRIILDAAPNPNHAPLIIAKQRGFFKEVGLDVTFINPTSSKNASILVTHKKADIGITYEPEFMKQVDQGLPLIRIGTLIDKPLNCLVISKDSGIKSLAELKGKRIGSAQDDLTGIMLKAMLKKQGLANNDIKYINIRERSAQALILHRVDAVTGLMRNMEVPALEANGHGITTYFPEDYGIPNYSELIFIANIDNNHDNRFPRFLAALRKAVVYVDTHPEETWAGFAKAYPKSNSALNHTAWLNTMPYFAEDPANADKNEWQHFAKFMHDNHLIKTVQPISRYLVALNE